MNRNVFFSAAKPKHALLVCFLRISAAFTTAIPSHKPTNNNIMVRLARQSDISNIERINVANLPENYTPGFYVHHLSMWPHLALVAEECCSAPEGESGGSISRGKLVGYALGKVGEKPGGGVVEDSNKIMQIMGHQRQYAHHHQVSTIGHITSIAVVPEQRRSGVGQSLMLQLHHQMMQFHGNCYICLHVRQSNKAAVRLYMEHLGYEIVDFVTCYYEVSSVCLDHCIHTWLCSFFLIINPYPHRPIGWRRCIPDGNCIERTTCCCC